MRHFFYLKTVIVSSVLQLFCIWVIIIYQVLRSKEDDDNLLSYGIKRCGSGGGGGKYRFFEPEANGSSRSTFERVSFLGYFPALAGLVSPVLTVQYFLAMAEILLQATTAWRVSTPVLGRPSKLV